MYVRKRGYCRVLMCAFIVGINRLDKKQRPSKVRLVRCDGRIGKAYCILRETMAGTRIPCWKDYVVPFDFVPYLSTGFCYQRALCYHQEHQYVRFWPICPSVQQTTNDLHTISYSVVSATAAKRGAHYLFVDYYKGNSSRLFTSSWLPLLQLLIRCFKNDLVSLRFFFEWARKRYTA